MFLENKKEHFLIYCEKSLMQYPLHIHQYIEFVHVVQGKLEMQIGQQKYLLNPGEIALIFPNIMHDYHSIPSKKDPADSEIHILNCSLDLLPMHNINLTNKYPGHPVLHKEEIHPDVFYAERRLYEIDMNDYDRALVSSLISLILSRILPYLDLTEHSEYPVHDNTNEIIAYIGLHFRENISQSSIAKHFCISTTTLSRIFSKVMKISFTEYVNLLRMDYAEYLLLSTNTSIVNIAFECGYQNQQTFFRIFKSMHSCTPKEYRNKSVNMDKVNNAENDYHNLPFEDVES